MVVLAGVAIARGIGWEPWDIASTYYIINYSDGLIRRGLFGSIVALFFDQAALPKHPHTIVTVHLVLLALLATGLVVWVMVRESGRRDFLLISLFGLFISSQFMETLALDTGFLDVGSYLLIIVAAYGFATRNLHMVVLPALAGPFLHEAFIFRWLPIVVLVITQFSITRRTLVLLLLPLLSAVAVYVFASPDALMLQLERTPLSESDKHLSRLVHFGQSAISALSIMLWKIRFNALNVGIAASVFTLPAFILISVYAWARKSRTDYLVLLACTAAPLSILLVGWDLSRFLVAANLYALLGVLFLDTLKPAPAVDWRAPAIATAAALVLIQLPFVYAYFELATIRERPQIVRFMPLRPLVESGVAFFNRNLGPKSIAMSGSDEIPGADKWYVEEDGWRGAWIRRPGTRTFDAVMTKGGLIAVYEVTVEKNGPHIIGRRYDVDPNSRWDYGGVLNGDAIVGTYPGGIWRAEIRK